MGYDMLCFKGFMSLPFQHSSPFLLLFLVQDPLFPRGFMTHTNRRTVCITQGNLECMFIHLFLLLSPRLFSLHMCVKTKWKFSVCQKLLFLLSDNNPKFGFLVIHLSVQCLTTVGFLSFMSFHDIYLDKS